MKSISNVLVCMSLCGLVSTRLVAEELPNVTGKVIDEIGNAVANADVTFLPYADYLEDVEQLYTRTDAKGEFALRVTRPMMYFQRSRVVAWKEGYGVGSAEVSPAGATASWGERKTLPVAQNLEIQLPKRSEPLRFQLVSPDGDPVRQVPVAVMAIYKSFAAGEYHLHTTHADGLPCLLRSTDANGMVDFDFLASGNFMAFMVKTENWGDQVGWVTAQQPEDDDRQLKLQPISKVRIQLKAQDQSPISGRKIRYSSQVEASRQVEATVMAYFNASQGVLETNQDGVAEANILAGKAWFSLQASPDDTSFEDHSRLNDVVLKAGSQTNLEISLEPGISVVGRVIDGDDKPRSDLRDRR